MRGERMFGSKPWIDGIDGQQTSDQQTGSGEKHDRDRELSDHNQTPHPAKR
jgi:hypothetical protein